MGQEVQVMTSAQTAHEPQSASRFMQMLSIPWVDKTIAIIAVVPNVVELYYRYSSADLISLAPCSESRS